MTRHAVVQKFILDRRISGLKTFHRHPFNHRFVQIGRLEQSQADQLDIFVVGQGNAAAGPDVFKLLQAGLKAGSNHHLVKSTRRPGKRHIALVADQVSRIEWIGVHQIDVAPGQQSGLLRRTGRGQQMQLETGAALQQRVEHVPTSKTLGRKIWGDQKI